jgi:F-type H+-transporting ATPase subunit b
MASGDPLQMFVVQLLAFILLVGILIKFVRPLLHRALVQRTQGIEETFKKIEQETAETARALSEFKEKLAQVEQERQRRLKAALDEAHHERDQILAESQAQAQEAKERAQREIGIERDKAILALRQEATRLTLQAADHVVEKAMNDSVQDRLVENYVATLESVKRP